MADFLAERAKVLDPTKMPGRPSHSLQMQVLPPAEKLILRARSNAIEAAERAFSVSLPKVPCRASTSGNRTALWLGPDEWLLLADHQEGCDLQAELAAKLAGLPHSLVAVDHRNVGLEISGPRATEALNSGCPLDLEISAFPVGMCTRTIFGKAAIVIWRISTECFRIEVSRSFALYVWQLLKLAGQEFE
jgi:sarcosine oxidase subunit gamma